MKERARSRKRKAQEVQCQQEEEPQTKKREALSSRDQEDLKQKKREKKPKNLLSGGNEESRFSDIFVCSQEGRKAKNAMHAVYSLQGLTEHEQAHQKSDNLNVERTKLQPKRVRFTDDMGTCKTEWNVSEEVCFHHGSALEESSPNGGAGQANLPIFCSYKNETTEEVRSQDGTMNLKAHHTGLSKDGKGPSTCKRQKDKDDEVWGKRFTPEEDEVLKRAILEYIKVQGWEKKEGIDKVLNCRKHKKAHKCWGVIRLYLPHRPRQAVRKRAYRLFEECTDEGHWSREEEELLKSLHREHGNQWKYLSTLIGRSQYSIKQKWRCLKRPNPTGVWTWSEMQKLSDLVHTCVRLKALGMEDGKVSHKILRDNVSWDNIADAIGTHNHNSCCCKWYCNLTSSMVIDGLWASEDDYRLLRGLLESGACTEEEVEWQRLLNHRSGQACLVRWKQMVKHLGENRTREFLEKLNSLVRRYAPELLSYE